MAIEYFPCYHSYRRKIAKLSDQEVGRLFRSLLEYSETGETQELAGRESVAFDFIAIDIDNAKEAYAEKCEKNRSKAKKRWNENDAMECSGMQQHADGCQPCQTKTKTKTKTISTSVDKSNKRQSRFRPPTQEEVAAYCVERKNNVLSSKFCDFYEANGWMVGKNHMKDWKAAVRNWERREKEPPKRRETDNERYTRELQDMIASEGGDSFDPWGGR